MAEVITNTQKMTDAFAGVGTDAINRSNHAKEKITIIDNEKRAFDDAISNLDQVLLTQIEDTNDTLEKVEQEYANRIDVIGCRSDLFWRVVGIDTGEAGGGQRNTIISLRCTKLAVTYPLVNNPAGTAATNAVVGYTTDQMMRYSPTSGVGTLPQIERVTMTLNEDSGELSSDGSAWDAYLQPDNLHGMKLYREPYDRDIADMFVATGVGTMAVNSNEIILLTTNLNLGIQTGHLVTTEGTTPFATQQTYVTGIGSTAKDLSSYSDIVNVATGSTTVHIVPMITVQDAAIVDTLAPNRDGVYTTFDFSKNPDTIDDKYAIEKTKSPYVPQTIQIQDFDQKGAGVEIKYVNNGVPKSVQEWNKFLEGFPDPDQLPDDIVEVEEPKVGAGKIYYRIGFPEKPVFPLTGDDAEEGDETQVIGNISWAFTLYETLPSCDNAALNAAISMRDYAESQLAGDNDFPKKIELANTVRTKRNELNLSIWAYRCHIGDADDQFSNANNFNETIQKSEYKDIMNATDL